MKRIMCAFLLVILLLSSLQVAYAGVFVSSGNIIRTGTGTTVFADRNTYVTWQTVNYSDIFTAGFSATLNGSISLSTDAYLWLQRYTDGSWTFVNSWQIPQGTSNPTVNTGMITLPKNTTAIKFGTYTEAGASNVTYTLTCGVGGYAASSDEVSAAVSAANTAATNATSALNAVSNSNGNTITAVRDSSGTVLLEARQAKTNSQNASTNALNAYNTAQTVNTKIDSLATAITNIQNNIGADVTPPEIRIATVSGALATSGYTVRAVINASDNVSTVFDYSLDGTVYQPLPHDGMVELPVSSTGSNLITVWVKDVAGNVGRSSITIRKL